MRLNRWWHYALVGGLVLALAMARRVLAALPRLVAGQQDWAEAVGTFAVVFLLGFGCGLLVWCGRGLSRRFGPLGDALIGMVVLPVFFVCCILVFVPEMRAAVLVIEWLPVLAVLLAIGLVSGWWIGRNAREAATEKEDKGKNLTIEDASPPPG